MRTLIVCATLALFAGTTPAAAQTFGFGAHAGVSLPTGDYSDAAELGFLGGLDLWYPLSAMVPGLSWYTSADAIAHSAKPENVDGGFLHIPLMTGLQFDIPVGPVSAFASGQLGIVFSKAPDDFRLGPVVLDGDSETVSEFGFNFGAGLRLTDNIYAGVKYYPLGDTDFGGAAPATGIDVSFLDVYVGFGVR